MIHGELENFEAMLSGLKYEPIYLDDYDAHIEEERAALNNLLYARYGRNDTLNSIPSCVCGELHDRDHEGKRCRTCGHECAPTHIRAIEPVLWVRVPDGVTSFINPVIFKMLKNILKLGSNSLLLWFCDSRYQFPKPDDTKLRRLDDFPQIIPGFRRGLNFFVENFEAILHAIMETKLITEKILSRSGILKLWDMYPDSFFTTVLPVPNRDTLLVEQNGTRLDADTKSFLGVDFFLTINSLHHRRIRTTIQSKENEITKAMDSLVNYYEKYMNTKVLTKTALIRKHVVGSRLNFTGRAVISSIHDVHHYQQIYIPWAMGIEIFKEHIRAKLLHQHMLSPNEITDLISQHVTCYHPLLDQVLKEIIAESPYYDQEGNQLGFPCTLQRNPSLARGSSQLFFIGKVKTERDRYGQFIDYTISQSVLTITVSNADFDGDEENLTLILDREMFNHFSRLEPHLSVLDVRRPWQVGGAVGMPSPQISTLGNWLHRTN